jgi:hypothetical protein
LRGGAEDSSGEDGLVSPNGKAVSIQIVSVPAVERVGPAEIRNGIGAPIDAVGMIRTAFEKKRTSAKGRF